jgi:hypothetical protein
MKRENDYSVSKDTGASILVTLECVSTGNRLPAGLGAGKTCDPHHFRVKFSDKRAMDRNIRTQLDEAAPKVGRRIQPGWD